MATKRDNRASRAPPALAFVVAVFLMALPAAASATRLYVMDSRSNSGKVFEYSVGTGGALSPTTPGTVPSLSLSTPAQLAVTPDGRFAYTTHGVNNKAIDELSLDSTGTLSPLSGSPLSVTNHLSNVAVAPNGVDVYFSETTTSGGVRHARIQPSGLLGPLDFAPANPHTADVVVTPNDQFVYAANDDGTVSRYTVGANGTLGGNGTTTVGSGLSSLAVAPNGQSLFVGSGGDGRIYSFHINGDGTLTAPAAPSIAGGTADMAIAPGGGFLYSAGGSSVYQFQINADSSLTALSPASVSSGGTGAQGIEVSPDGLSAYAVNGTGGGVAQYDIGAGGTLTAKAPATVVPDSSSQSEPYGAAIEPAQGGSAIVYTGHSTLVNGPLPVTPTGAGTGTNTGAGVTGTGPITQEALLSGAAAQLLAAQGLVPVAGRTLIAAPVAGTVLVKLPGSNKFVPLETVTSIPVGTIIDARKGQVGLIAAIDAAGHTQSSVFYGGVFRVTQPITTAAAARKRIVDLRLVGSLGTCRASSKKSASEARRRRHRHLWGNGRGSFRTRGRYASATVRGTKWLMTDTCSTTTTVVARGTVTVFDSVRDLTVRVKAGHRYTARRGTRK